MPKRAVAFNNKIRTPNTESKDLNSLNHEPGWLRKRAAAGKVLPSTPNDMMKMMMEPDGGMSKKLSMRR
jgi:hypothetical protein